MPHEIAKSLLESANTAAERVDAIRGAIQLGMPLAEIQDYLDWLDHMGRANSNEDQSTDPGDDANS